ncbi:MAG: hypothetical protein PCFJNLEI_03740 [Verrucomicrobiae bacterium]|nr:hypothetical protein [Verrucomicrobiae bacterium]
MRNFLMAGALLLSVSGAFAFHEPATPPLPNFDLRVAPNERRQIYTPTGFQPGPPVDPLALGDARLKCDYTSPHSQMRTKVWQQVVDGIPVFGGVLVMHTTKHGELVGQQSRFVPNPGNLQAKPKLPAAQAVVVATNNVGAAISEPTTRLVWLPADQLTLCWEVIVTGRETYRLVVDATTGKIWVRQCLTEYFTDATYRVFTADSPAPFSPGHTTPSTNQPATVARSLVTLSALSSNASPNGWINDGDNTTLGNNVDAHLDRNANDSADPGSRPPGNPARTFDFAVNLAAAPVTYTNASVVCVFYWCNWMHDKLYNLGFTEAAGNFQTDNFGRGGLSDDAVQADVQDGGGFNNANFTTPLDGTAPRMQMFLWNSMTPNRDGAFDAEIILHEYTHGLSNRRVGGGVGITQPQSRGMGEGWSDFFALALLSEPADNVDGNYAFAAYVTQNYYWGIRRYPYTTDLNKNPLTFKDIDLLQIEHHPGIPKNPGVGVAAADVHRQGEVWASALWEARANLIRKHGAATGNQLMLQLVCDAMSITPANPTFVEGRDAILQADFVLTGGANAKELWAGFAKRGLGWSAVASASSTVLGVVETFDVPDDLQITPVTGGALNYAPADMAFVPGCTNYTLLNTGSATLNWTASKSQTWLEVTPTSGTLTAGATTTVAVCINAGANTLPVGFYYDSVIFTNTTTGVPQYRGAQLCVQAFAGLPFTEGFESGAFSSYWTITGSYQFRTILTNAYSPHGGSRQLTMDTSINALAARNEATLGINLAGYTNVVLSFWAKSFGDESNGPPTAPFVNHADFDGVAISNDGATWWEIQSLRGLTTGVWTQFVVNLNNVPVGYSGTWRIRFNQYDNFGITGADPDGIAIDDISITGALFDTDGDGLPDWWEQTYFMHPTNAVAGEDGDGDGLSNLEEFLAGTVPTSAASAFRITSVAGFTVTWSCGENRTYQVLYAPAPGGPWLEDLPASEVTTTSGETIKSYTDPTASAADRRFYKIRLVVP